MKYLAYLAIFVLFQHAASDLVPQNASSATTTISSPTTKEIHHASECELSESSKLEKKLLERLNQFKGRNFTWNDTEHKYFLSICSKAEKASFSDEAFIQIENKSGKNRQWVLGRLNDVDLEGNGEFIRVSYKNGDKYENACNKNQRNAVFYLMCDPNKINPEFTMLEENTDRQELCAYVFMIKTKDMCLQKNQTTTATSTSTTTTNVQANSTKASDPTTTSTANTNSTSTLPSEKKSKLGVLSIILIALTGLLAVYFVVGTLYMRFVNQATGWEQIPNFGFWNAIGEGSADLCNLICRCGNRRTEIHTYENINDHISDDENLLNM